MDRLKVINHPLVHDYMSQLRDEKTSSEQFRRLISRLTIIAAYEATQDLPVVDVVVKTPICDANCKQLSDKKIVLLPIMRAGLAMLDSMFELLPDANVAHMAMARNETTFEAEVSYTRLSNDIEHAKVIILDPMLATGGSALKAVKALREIGVKDITFMCIVAAPQGVKLLLENDEDLNIFACALDDDLNDKAYIVPGLGDAGDRVYGNC